MGRQVRSRTRLEPEVRRELILDAAEDVFRGRVPTEVTFEEVADAADVSRALVYNYFGDRNGLLAAVYVRTLGRLDVSLLASLDPALAPVDQLRPLARAYLDFARENGATWQVLAANGAVQHPSVQAIRRTRFERLAALWGNSAEARIAARTVAGMLEAATVDWLDEDGIDDELVVETVCRFLTYGLDGCGGLDAPSEMCALTVE
jgi:AcrR family transcriptional regulator